MTGMTHYNVHPYKIRNNVTISRSDDLDGIYLTIRAGRISVQLQTYLPDRIAWNLYRKCRKDVSRAPTET